MKILALTRYGRLGASSRLRTFQFVDRLADEGIDLEPAPLFEDGYVADLYAGRRNPAAVAAALARRVATMLSRRGYDAIWVEKEALPWFPGLLELPLLIRDLPVVLDMDDAVFHRYDSHRNPLVRRVFGHKLDRIMAAATLIVAGNQYLADHARRAGATNIEIVPTVIDLERYVPARRPLPPRPVIGWIGTPGTAKYLDAVLPVLSELRSTLDFAAVAIGARPGQFADGQIEVRPWSEATEVDQLRDVDIGIMPLPDSPFERGKCGYKLIQYMALGIPVVAAPVGANRTIVIPGENGFWATRPDEWRYALLRLLKDPTLRATLGARGRAAVERTYSLQVQAPRLARLLKTTVRRLSASLV